MKIFDTPPKAGIRIGHKMFFHAFLRMAKAWDNLSVNDGHVDWSNGIPTIVLDEGGESGEGGGVDYSDFAFGFTLNPDGDNTAEIGINAGKVRHGTRTPVSVTSDKIVIGTDQTWVFVAYTFGSTGTITSSTTEPEDTETVHNHALYLVTLTGGIAGVDTGDIKHLGDIFIPGVYA